MEMRGRGERFSLGKCCLSRHVVNAGLPSLRLLILSRNMPDPVSAPKEGAGLMKMKWHLVFYALHLGHDDPAVVAESGIGAGFSAAGDTFDVIVIMFKILFNMDVFQHGFVHDFFMADRQFQKYREAPVRFILIFTGAGDADIVVAGSPVFRKSRIETLRALGDEIEGEVGATAHHLPR